MVKLKRFLIVNNNDGDSTDEEESQSANEDESVSELNIGVREIKAVRCCPLKDKDSELQMVPEIRATIPKVNPDVPKANPCLKNNPRVQWLFVFYYDVY